MDRKKNIFLTAEWRKLIMANYLVEPSILLPYLPVKTAADLWKGDCYISLVGFLFDKVKVKGISVPFHTRFPEINLRFYVKYKEGANSKRGVVFLSEIVPKPAIAWVANKLFKEHYSSYPMRHELIEKNNDLIVSYRWRKDNNWNKIEVTADSSRQPLVTGSNEEFITEHFWGYDIESIEYEVEHPRWDIYNINSYAIECDFSYYGKEFSFLNKEKPVNVFMAEGSPVKVSGKKLI